MQRFSLFVAIFSTLLAIVWFYVWTSLVSPLLTSSLLYDLGLGFFLITYLLQLLRWFYFRQGDESKGAILFTYYLLGLMSQLFFLALAKDLSWWGLDPFLNLSYTSYSCFFLCAGVLLNFWGTLTALKGPVIREVNVTLKSWPKQQAPIKIAQISDLHIGPIIKKNYVEKIIQKTLHLKPDMIVMTGDIGDGRVAHLESDIEPLKKLQAPLGSYFVTGNHEYYWGAEEWIQKISQMGFEYLANSGKNIKIANHILYVAGVPDISDRGSSPSAALKSCAAEASKVLLAHQPKSCFAAEKAGYELMLCGHTHWGQYFPFTLLVGLFNPFSKSLNRFKDLQIYINAGTGFWGPPLRLGAASEITLITLSAE